MNQVIRFIHRWTSLLFSLIVASVFAGMAITTLPEWYYYLPLPPLFVLIPTGIYMFFAPYFSSRQDALPATERRA
ncbi:hypothetical protein EDC40_104283 [Aminobacter aminovorans]|jgi:1,4-dihydroxy-2-naphthoate octaprenyltransferase|uniref:Transmembrane protein n=1 Tax=Aminobacter aminovorans TaxID=83263 RepID=A0A380WIR3_AMIAI|nr:hypothetical protein [Aminobacter aminovorans]TCS26815.1 hypothetical protein EDC40_104283 [Aminobacter aminovorans]SUU88126.1 Uncharacterised protein [Aminobacter aminovorans]